jgi:hypothetical protein
MTSRKPRVVTIAAAGSRRVMSAFVATVVPWQNSATSSRRMPAAATPASTPSIGFGVEETFATSSAPSRWSRTQTSVNVPPTSTATTLDDPARMRCPSSNGVSPLILSDRRWGF